MTYGYEWDDEGRHDYPTCAECGARLDRLIYGPTVLFCFTCATGGTDEKRASEPARDARDDNAA